MTRRRFDRRAGLRLGWLLLAAGGLTGLLAGTREWWSIVSDSGRAAFSGSDASGGLTGALPAVVLVGLLLSWTLRRIGARVVAVMLFLTGVGMVVLGVWHPRPSDAALLDVLRTVSLADRWSAAPTGWVWAYAVAGLLVVAGALLLLRGAGSTRTAERFRPDAAEQLPPEAADADDPEEWGDAETWKALDGGVDPTDRVR